MALPQTLGVILDTGSISQVAHHTGHSCVVTGCLPVGSFKMVRDMSGHKTLERISIPGRVSENLDPQLSSQVPKAQAWTTALTLRTVMHMTTHPQPKDRALISVKPLAVLITRKVDASVSPCIARQQKVLGWEEVYFKTVSPGWRDSLAVKNTHCSNRQLRFWFPASLSQLTAICISGQLWDTR